MSSEDKEELQKMIVQDKDTLQVLKNTLTVYNYFCTEIATSKVEEEKKDADKKSSPEEIATMNAIDSEL